MATQLWSIFLVIIGSLIGGITPIWMKKGSGMRFDFKSILRNHYLFGAVFFQAVGLVVYVIALKGGDVAVLYPLAAINHIWAVLLSIRFLGEKMNNIKWTAISLILLGAVLIGVNS